MFIQYKPYCTCFYTVTTNKHISFLMEDSKKIYCSKAQKEMLIELLKKDSQLISGKFTSTFTFKDARNRWIAIADTLNAIPGCVKDWSQWKRVRNNNKLLLHKSNYLYLILIVFYAKTWQDSRSKVRSKKSMVNRHLNGTGGEPQVS